jgi:hypothetical protein
LYDEIGLDANGIATEIRKMALIEKMITTV